MRWELATDEQLWTIIQDDRDCPKELLEKVVEEGFARNLFDNLIKHLINKMFDRWSEQRQFHFQDLIQLGVIGVFHAIKNYQPGKGSFKTFAYMNIKSEFTHLLDKERSEKRKVYENICSIDVQRHDDNDETFKDSLIDIYANVEKQALSSVFWDEQFEKLGQREKEVLQYFAEGYTLSEMAKFYNLKTTVSLHRQLHRAFNKINPGREKINLKDSGLMTRTKEKVGA
ncbi:sigma-70 family RNA polymerase sigma factor [Metabacillus sp. GX 13764]|uniref:sigma-70 family RNA polymerase sigma factor n=1 Tax=Metabacillus kandeliae TaxID=2900151 RepID=UPI001E3D11E4|nr:sigma-70 family RNA polymerase sigma factor [Metabacillus kandeliae]MCD7034325.1 sigma-70 family RNA polymerase sigma factor [Metabacillus kandeliae]